MSVRYDPLLVRALAREILDRWGGVHVTSIRLDRPRRVARMSFADGSCLLCALHPTTGHLLALDDEACRGVELGGTERRFRRLPLIAAEAAPDERALLLIAGQPGGRPVEALALELHTNRWNALDLTRAGDDDSPFWRIEAALLTRESGGRALRRGLPYEMPGSTRGALVELPTEEAWATSFEDVPDDERRGTLLRRWAWTSTLNAEWILGGGAFDPAGAYARYRALREEPQDARSGWTLARRWGPQPYPVPLEGGTRADGGLLGAFRDACEAAGGLDAILSGGSGGDQPEEDGEAAQLARRLAARHKRARKRVRALERQLAQAGPPEAPREAGQLLLARKADVPKGAARVTLEAFDGTEREIELDPALDAIANAERFFDEARRRERAAERLPSEIERAAARRDDLAAALERLAADGPSDELWELAGGQPIAAKGGGAGSARRSRRADADRQPYTRLRSSGGLEIRVGRGARDNDALTFRHSAPDDIWLHASQSSGAHVILRWGKKEENPPQRDLLEAAVAAAVHSGARHSGTVAVVWTRRKHVRKPRKSPPGTVIPERVKTVFVSPDEERVRAMRAD